MSTPCWLLFTREGETVTVTAFMSEAEATRMAAARASALRFKHSGGHGWSVWVEAHR